LRSYLNDVTDADVAKLKKTVDAVGTASDAPVTDYYSRYEVVTPGARSAAVSKLNADGMAAWNKAQEEAKKAADDGEEKKDNGPPEEPVAPVPGHANKAL